MNVFAKAINKAYPDAIKTRMGKFYYENSDMPPARFVFHTEDECAEDLALEIGMKDEEAISIITSK